MHVCRDPRVETEGVIIFGGVSLPGVLGRVFYFGFTYVLKACFSGDRILSSPRFFFGGVPVLNMSARLCMPKSLVRAPRFELFVVAFLELHTLHNVTPNVLY